MKKYAVIVAAGSGIRMGSDLPKQFLELDGKPLLLHTLLVFLKAFTDMQIILVVHPDHTNTAKTIAAASGAPLSITIIAGSSSRSGSVRNGLDLVPDDSIVFVHDGVRCLLSKELVQRCYHAATETGNAVPAIPAVDSVRILKNGHNEWIDRNAVRLVQTPQTFRADVLKEAYRQAGNREFTDDAAVAEHAGITINLVEGETTNIKITHPADLAMAEIIQQLRSATS